MIINDKVPWSYTQHQKPLGSWAALHGPFTCRCGAEDHVEAVKKLQNSTKLLQKVVIPCRAESAWALPGIGSRTRPLRPSRCAVCQRGGWREGSGRRRRCLVLLPTSLLSSPSISEQPESAERPGCARGPQPQERPGLGRSGHVTQARDKAGA